MEDSPKCSDIHSEHDLTIPRESRSSTALEYQNISHLHMSREEVDNVTMCEYLSTYERRPAFIYLTTGEKKQLAGESVTQIARLFAKTSAIHGINHVIQMGMLRNPMHWKNKLYAVSLLLCFSLSTWSVSYLVMKYLRYEVVHTVDTEFLTEMDFPAVTLCNINKIRVGKTPPETVPTHELEAGHTIDEMLISCSFSGQPCNSSDFYWLWHEHLGNCYTFNNYKNNLGAHVPSKVATLAGTESSLTLMLDVHYHEYSPTTNGVGVAYCIHDRNQFPHLDDCKTEASTGFWTSVRVAKTKKNDLKSQCIEDGESIEVNEANSFYANKYAYSLDNCLNTCIQVEAMKTFNCCMKLYPCNPLKKTTMFRTKLDTNINYCKGNIPVPSWNWRAHDYNLWQRQKRILCQILCLPACKTAKYEASQSFFRWPRVNSSDDALCLAHHASKEVHKQTNHTYSHDHDNEHDHDDHDDHDNDNMTNRMPAKNALALNIFMGSFQVTSKTLMYSYSLYQLVSNIGGVLSIGLGFSFVSGIEIIEFIIDVVTHVCCWDKRREITGRF